MNLKVLFLAVALLAITPMCFAAQIFVDDFQVNAAVFDFSFAQNLTATNNNIGTGNATRTLTLTPITGQGSNLQVRSATTDTSISTDANVEASFEMLYDFGQGGFDLSDGGLNTVVAFDFEFIEQGTVFDDFILTLDSGAGAQTINFGANGNDAINIALGLDGQQDDLNNVNFNIDFIDFENLGINFVTIETFDFDVNFGQNKEIIFDFISTNAVPEPGTYFMIALLGLVAFVRGRKKMAVENK